MKYEYEEFIAISKKLVKEFFNNEFQHEIKNGKVEYDFDQIQPYDIAKYAFKMRQRAIDETGDMMVGALCYRTTLNVLYHYVR